MPGKKFIPATFVVLWATGFIGARYAMPWAEPFTFLAVRFGLAVLVLAAIGYFMGARRATPRQALNSAIAGGLMHGVYLGCVFWAIHAGLPAGISALIVGLQPLITTVFAGIFLGETILPRHWAGLAAGFAGVVIVLLPKVGGVAGDITLPMLAASLVAVVAISAGTVLQKRLGAVGDLVTGTTWQFVGAGVLMAFASLAFETRTVVLTGELVFATLWLVFVLSIGAVFLLMVLIRDGAMSKVSSLFYLVPAVTAIMAWLLFGESLTWVQLVGMAITTFGVGLATSRPRSIPA